MKYWAEEEIEFLIEWYPIEGAKLCAKVLDRTIISVYQKAFKLGINSPYASIQLTNVEYKLRLKDTEYLPVEPYINTYTKIKHLHINCGYIWKVRPNAILNNRACPQCTVLGNIPTYFYWINFPKLGLDKVGITTNINRRHHELGEYFIIKHSVKFDTRRKAYDLEQYYLGLFKPYMINTGELKSGNTETFKWP